MAITDRYADGNLGRSWKWWVVGGLLAVLGGIYALFNPVAASLTVTVFAGLMFIVLGVVQIITAVQMREHGGFVWKLLLGILMVLTGVILLTNPLAGMVALTVVVGAAFFGIGVAKVLLGLRIRPREGWGWIVFSGAISLLLAALIFGDFPRSAVTILGILLAVEWLATGFTFLFRGLAPGKLGRLGGAILPAPEHRPSRLRWGDEGIMR